MKLCVTLLKVVLVVVFIEAVLGDVEGGDLGSSTVAGGESSGTAERVCPIQIIDYANLPIFGLGAEIWNQCVLNFKIVNEDKMVNVNVTTEEVQIFIDSFCQNMPILFECLKEKALDLEECPDTTMHKVFNIMRELLVHHLESGCSHNGTRFLKLISEFSVMSPVLKTQINNCIRATVAFGINEDLNKYNVDYSSKLFFIHNQFPTLKKCLSNTELGSQLKEVIGDIVNETHAIMKCIDPRDGSLVSCTTLDATSVSFPNICEVITQNSEISLYDILEEEGFKWFSQTLTHDTQTEDISSDNEKLREDFKGFCDRKVHSTYHLARVSAFATLCLNDTQEKEFELLVDTVKDAFEPACIDNGTRLADIMLEVYRLKKTSPDHSHAVWDCIDVARATRKHHDDHVSTSKNMRFYHEMETFKGCLVNKLHGDQTSVDAATSLIEEMLKIVKCVKPEDGTTVTCEALMHSNGHAHGHGHGHTHAH